MCFVIFYDFYPMMYWYLQKEISIKTEPDPPIVTGTDPRIRIRIRTKMSRMEHWLKVTELKLNSFEEAHPFLPSSYLSLPPPLVNLLA